MIKNILIVAAHPDDEVLGCGGTIAKLAHEGHNVHIIYLTDGIGARDESDIESVHARFERKEAAKNAAQILGANSPVFGDFPDNGMDTVALLNIIKFIERQLIQIKPDIVLTHHGHDLNIDHCKVHQAVVTACRPQPWQTVKTLLFFEVPSSTEWQAATTHTPFVPAWYVDITDFLEVRTRALQAYDMELREWPHSRSLQAITHLAHWRGASVGIHAAEAFMLGRHIVSRNKQCVF